MHVMLIRLNTSTQETVEAQVDIEDRVVLGRHVGSPLLFQGEAISRQHFALFVTDGQLMIENLSGNGTLLNGEALTVERPSSLLYGDLVEVPGYQIRMELREASHNQAATEVEVPVWQRNGRMILNFFDPLEIALLICGIACICLFTYYIVT
jgi:pSer/pThr/pTyr-binding forkhead associated (FHA) protein